MFDVVALGELLIDFTESGLSKQGNPIMEANPGGAPCNVLSMLNRLGKKTAFIGKVGKDAFGQQLITVLRESGIDTSNLIMDEKTPTTLAFIHTLPDGDRQFSFYQNPGADMMLRKEEISEDIIKNGKIFHFGTLSSTHEGVREATRHAIYLAEKNGLIISFDPNLREPLWQSLEEAKKEIAYGMSKCNILKIADNELEFMTGQKDYHRGIEILQKEYSIKLILLTMGKKGSRAYYGDLVVEEKSFLMENTIETTGAGDTFMGCILSDIRDRGLNNLKESDLREMLIFANAAAALITTEKGALKVMPEKEEILALISGRIRNRVK